MPILHRIPPDVLAREYVYRGWFAHIVPVYVGRLDNPNGTAVSTRNGIPEFLLPVASWLWALVQFAVAPFAPEFADRGLPIGITGRLDGRPLELE